MKFSLSKKYNNAQNQHHVNGAGFTLMEVVITIGVVSVGVIGALTLALANLKVVHENYDRIFAANLAREGIELIKNVRDSNWLRMEANEDCDSGTGGLQLCAWNEYLDHSVGYYKVDYLNIGNAPPTSNTSNDYATDNKLIYQDASVGLYSHDGSGVATLMHRTIEIESICLNEATLVETIGGHSNCSDKQIGIKVTANMYWNRYNEANLYFCKTI